MYMRFNMLPKHFTDSVAWLWGDLLDLERPATFEEAYQAFQRDFGGNFDDYYDDAGLYKGPCALGISVEESETYQAGSLSWFA